MSVGSGNDAPSPTPRSSHATRRSGTAVPNHARLHYRGRVHIAAVDPGPDAWGELIRAIRWWIGERPQVERNEAFTGGKWMFVGGEWCPPGGRVRVTTRCLTGSCDDHAPEFWALAFRHPCGQERFRRWQTDFGVTRVDDGFDLSIAIHHWLVDGFIGEEPERPCASAPGIVGRLIASPAWRVTLGPAELGVDPLVLREGDGAEFKSLLEEPSRTCPLVLVSRDHESGQHLVDASRLAQLLAGTALVYVVETSGTDTELEWLFPRGFRCWNGMVRIYLPRVQFDRPWDANRHRFFWPDQIESLGADTVERFIVEGLARRFSRPSGPSVESVSDVEDLERHQRIELLRAKPADGDNQEWKMVLEEEVDRLTEDLRSLEGTKREAQDLEEQLRTANYLRKDAEDRAAKARRRVQEARGLERAMQILDVRPHSLMEALELIAETFPESILFTDEAKQSARKAGINGAPDELGAAWNVLWHMATTLHEMSFADPESIDGQFDEVFKHRSGGLDLALTEKKQTKRDARLRAKRKCVFEGRELDITPHLKHGNDKKTCLRVHYAAVRCEDGRELIVVGHCGDHLETAGTRKIT